MKVILSPMDAAGCGSYRMLYPMRVLQAQGYDVDVRGQRLEPCEGGVVVLQRPTWREVAEESIAKLQAKGYAVVIEVDDDLSALHPQHISYRRLHPKFMPDDNYQWLARCCEQADLVITSTPKLAAKYAPHGRYVVLRNLIRAQDIASEPSTGQTFTWAGQAASHPMDANEAERGILALIQKGWDFHTFDPDTARSLGVPASGGQWVPLDRFVISLRRFGLGVVPLVQSEFNQSKSWLKGLEYAAAGVPFVATPTPAYRELYRLGAGVLASTPKEWRRQLLRLADDENARRELAEAGLQAARSLTYEEHAHLWWDAWRQARANYEGRKMSCEAHAWVNRPVEALSF